ncbi:MAG: peptidoglycan-associated lipoprotein Pal [Nitrococcus sp.]|nr:peptidoglycan-associated lipoprotein Pal [Nitrococcus sp.]
MPRLNFQMAALFLALALMMGGCVGTGNERAAGGPLGIEGSGTAASGAQRGQSFQGTELDNPASPLSKRVIYFEFDSNIVQPEYLPILQAHGEYLATHPEYKVTIEGHTDERGSREYNLALGERRAEAAQRILLLNGAAKEQLSTVSYGEEKPVDPGHDEAAWAKNRRAVLVYYQ